MAAIDDLAKKIKGLAERKGQELSDSEAVESAHKLTGYFELLIEFARRDAAKKRRLKDEPNGFPVDGQYSCMLCKESINSATGWYDWYGHTCFPCRKAVLNKTIPTYVFKNSDSYFTTWELEYHFKLKRPAVRKYIKEGILIPRTVPNENGSVHCYIFLKEDNPNLITRYSPERKSFDRHREKWASQKNREWKKEFLEKRKKELVKIKKRADSASSHRDLKYW